jgi:hypothetical protein
MAPPASDPLSVMNCALALVTSAMPTIDAIANVFFIGLSLICVIYVFIGFSIKLLFYTL